jgi:hypothetical protein
VLNGLLVVVSLLHAVLWLWKSFGPWEGIRPELRITDIQLVLKVLKVSESAFKSKRNRRVGEY